MNGYKAELHEVRTRDGWKLSMVRLMIAPEEEEVEDEVPKEEEKEDQEPTPDPDVIDEEDSTPTDDDGKNDPSPSKDDLNDSDASEITESDEVSFEDDDAPALLLSEKRDTS